MNIKFLDFKQLKDFPSGSGIESFDNKIYIVGDDAKDIIVVNKNWKLKETIKLFPSDTIRIAKQLKADYEATTIVHVNKIPFLLILGSGSIEATRNKGMLINLTSKATEEIDLSIFYNRLKQSGFEELNIEAVTLMGDKLILSNRGNKLRPDNRIIVTSADFWKKQQTADIFSIKIEWEQKTESYMTLSGLTYSYQNDWLILTASVEDTDNAIDDGLIGDSYLGVIENISRKIGRSRLKLNSLFNLAKLDKTFKGHKIESVCIQGDKEHRLKLHLVADNDTGDSHLFKVRLKE